MVFTQRSFRRGAVSENNAGLWLEHLRCSWEAGEVREQNWAAACSKNGVSEQLSTVSVAVMIRETWMLSLDHVREPSTPCPSISRDTAR